MRPLRRPHGADGELLHVPRLRHEYGLQLVSDARDALGCGRQPRASRARCTVLGMARRRSRPDASATPLKAPLDAAAAKSPHGKRPEAFGENRKEKKNYAQNLSTELALLVAECLRPHYRKARVTPNADGTGHEFSIGSKIDSKKTDVGVWDDAAGLILGVSIKTYSFRDYHGATATKPAHLGRYQRNVKRNDMELRDEADTLHRRQPYATLFALFFMPRDACWDGVTGHSSFAHAVFTLRKRAGRLSPDASRSDLFEKVYVGLFEDDGSVAFFDVQNAPRRNQPPQETLSLADLVEVMRMSVTIRNEGISPEERYAPDDAMWRIPENSLPVGLDIEDPLEFEQAIRDEESADDDE